MEAQLAAQGIEYQRTSRRINPPDTVFIKTTAGVEIGFELQSPDEAAYTLESISWDGGRAW
ncbi:MAG TPA: hypothetical protein VHB98_18075 [Chloroflexota bacterium]|nr:hypothetical protein [Chloroflexota bacterium]